MYLTYKSNTHGALQFLVLKVGLDTSDVLGTAYLIFKKDDAKIKITK